MKSILNLFKKSPEEERLEAELSGKVTSTRQTPSATSTPPKRGTSPASPATPGSADVELSELRSSLQAMDQRLLVLTHERDSLRAEFSQYREAVSQDQRSLEAENRKLKESLDATSMLLSKQIAAGGLNGPLPGISSNDDTDGPKGLQRAIQANKQASTTPLHQRSERIL